MPPHAREDINHQEDQLLIGGLNVRGLRGKADVIKSLILSYQFDIFVIIDTNFDEDHELQGYRMYRFDRPGDDSGGGILIYCRTDLPYVREGSRYTRHGNQSDIQILHIPFSAPVNLDLIAVYSPSNTRKMTESARNQELVKNLKSVFKKVQANKVVLVGDFNIDYSVDNPGREVIKQCAFDQGLEQVIQDVTRVEARHFKETEEYDECCMVSSTLIDHIYVKTQLLNDIISKGVIRFGMSDHDLIYCNIKSPGFNPHRAHHKKSEAVKQIEEVKQRFMSYYDECLLKYLNKLTYTQTTVMNKWSGLRKKISKTRNKYIAEGPSPASQATLKCKTPDDRQLETLHNNHLCAPCSIRSP